MTDAELTRALAERVMGWEIVPLDCDSWPPGPPYLFESSEGFWRLTTRTSSNHWNPLESVADAFMLVEKLRNSGKYCCIDINSDYNYCWRVAITKASEDPNTKHEPFAISDGVEALPRAICSAAAQAAGIEV